MFSQPTSNTAGFEPRLKLGHRTKEQHANCIKRKSQWKHKRCDLRVQSYVWNIFCYIYIYVYTRLRLSGFMVDRIRIYIYIYTVYIYIYIHIYIYYIHIYIYSIHSLINHQWCQTGSVICSLLGGILEHSNCIVHLAGLVTARMSVTGVIGCFGWAGAFHNWLSCFTWDGYPLVN